MADFDDRPGIVPLRVYRDPEFGYSIFHPVTWHCFTVATENGRGVLFSPSLDDVSLSLSVEVRDIGTRISAGDLPALRRSFLLSLRKLPGSKILRLEEYDVGFMTGIEVYQTYREDQVRRKRWIRLLFWGTRQVRLIAQGATEADFDAWLPSFNPAMTAFTFGEVLPDASPHRHDDV